MGLFGSTEGKEAKRELAAALHELEQAERAREHQIVSLRTAKSEITSGKAIAKHGRVHLYSDRVVTPSGQFPLEPELSAAVDTAGAISSRVTATRLVLTGPFALAMKKKKDDRELFLYVDSPAGQHVEPCRPEDQARVRLFASKITTAARQAKPGVSQEARVDELRQRYEALDAPDSAVRLAFAEFRALEERLRDAGQLPERYSRHDDLRPLAPF